MEQIIRKDGNIYYGKELCQSADDAYRKYRDDYHCELGKRAYLRLNRLGSREERIHGFGFRLRENPDGNWGNVRVPYRLLGLVGISYCRIVGLWDMPDIPDDDFDSWIDWLFLYGNKSLFRVGLKDKSGRTSKRAKTRYR